MVVTISNRGYIKRNPITLYRSQRRGGKGVTAMGTREDDFVERLFVASTHHTFLFFSNLGKVYWCKCYDIPAGRPARASARPSSTCSTWQEQRDGWPPCWPCPSSRRAHSC
ncbi:MAG: hypothetical protein MZV70_64310 [Desulfobacterales bacterium]|nr:hypothetical protein [Desulfobacterales bacterium]